MPRYTLTITKLEQLDDYLLVTFAKPKDLVFEDGQYGVFLHVMQDVEGRKVRAFSFASSNQESDLKIGTKISSSGFKIAMTKLAVGDQMTVDGPLGRFVLESTKTRVFIAGGIGITPIRSMIMGQSDLSKDLLIYSESREVYPFLEDFEYRKGLTVQLASGQSRTSFLIEQASRVQGNQAVYYICGSPSFVGSISNQLAERGITPNNIKFERLTGY